jgi:hypothetical protein
MGRLSFVQDLDKSGNVRTKFPLPISTSCIFKWEVDTCIRMEPNVAEEEHETWNSNSITGGLEGGGLEAQSHPPSRDAGWNQAGHCFDRAGAAWG